MNKQQKVLHNLQESVQYTFEEIKNDENNRNLDKVEMLQDKFDALLQIIETQAHRVRFTLLLLQSKEKEEKMLLDFVNNFLFQLCRFPIWVSNLI